MRAIKISTLVLVLMLSACAPLAPLYQEQGYSSEAEFKFAESIGGANPKQITRLKAYGVSSKADVDKLVVDIRSVKYSDNILFDTIFAYLQDRKDADAAGRTVLQQRDLRLKAEAEPAAYRKSNLPACWGNDTSKWDKCIGTWKACNRYDCEEYTGEYRDGRINGIGQMSYIGGNFYYGEWRDGKYNGQGRLSESKYGKSGYHRYVGEFKYGKFDGRGIQYEQDHIFLQSGVYKDGILVTPQIVELKSFTNIPLDLKDGRQYILQADVPDRDLRRYPPDDSGNWEEGASSWKSKVPPRILAIKPEPPKPKKSKAEEQEEKAQLDYLRNVCKNPPKATGQVIEYLSSELRTDPQNIRLVRVELYPEYIMGPRCIATFYTLKGKIDVLILGFDKDGLVNSVMLF